jgi:radical SAM superfamily enzyme YgiQ (UPF0313 family)
MTSSIADAGETLAPLMRKAGFRYVFLGIENVLDDDLGFLRAQAKNRRRVNGQRQESATLRAIEHIHGNDMYVVGGIIVGNPGDTRQSIETNLEFARRYVDWPYIQHPTPYPRTPMTRELKARDLIVNENLEEYDGTTAVVKTEHVNAEEIEFLRWRAERWMKVRHLPAALAFNPVSCSVRARGCWRTPSAGAAWDLLLGGRAERAAFERYRAIRRAEREYL